MIEKQPGLARRLQHLAARLYRRHSPKVRLGFVTLRVQRSLILIILLFGLSMAVPSVVAQVSESIPIVQSQAAPVGLVEKGKKLYETGDFEEAAAVLKQSADTFAAYGDKLNQAMALSNLSLIYQKLGQWELAKQVINDSLGLLETQPKTKERARILAQTLDIQGKLQRELGQPEESLKTWQKATEIYTQIENKDGATQSQINQVLALQDLGLYPRACNTLLAVLELDIQDCDQLSLLTKSELTEKLQVFQNQPASLLKVQGLRNLGEVLQVLGQPIHSQILLEASLNLAEELDPSPDRDPEIAAVHLSLGNTARVRGNFEEAWQHYQQAAESATVTTQIRAQLNQLSLLVKRHSWSQVPNLASKIKSSLNDLPASRTVVEARINLAQSLICFKESKLSDEERERSSPILQQCILTEEEEKSFEENGLPVSEILNWEEIAEIVTAAVKQAETLGNKRVKAYALGYLGGVYQQMGKIKLAQKETEKALYLARSREAPEIAYQWQWQLGRLLKAQSAQAQTAKDKIEFLKKAEAAYKRAYSIVNSLRQDLLYYKREIQFDFRDRFEPIYREYVSLRLPFNNKDNDQAQFILLPEAEKPIEDTKDVNTRKVIADLQLAELENFLECNLVYGSKFVDVDKVVDNAEKKTAAIYPIILEDRIEVLLKLPQEERLYRRFPPVSISQKEVKEKLQQLRKELEQPYFSSKRGKPVAQEVYNWLIEPAEKQGLLEREQTLVFVLDGPFRNISMAALYDGNEYLIQKYAIAVALGNLELPRSKPKKQFKALIAGLSKKPKFQPPQGEQFGPLKYVEQEVNGINDVLRESNVEAKILYDDQFTSKALENEIKTAPYNIVHLATHGEFGFSRDSTFILTAPPESEDKFLRKKDNLKSPFSDREKKIDTNSEGKITSTNATLYDFEHIKTDLNELDNLLQVREQAPIELLVLSACETATGDDREVLGIAGMAVQSGARSTLASLWSIDDSSTAELMERFYQELTEKRVTKAEALRQAQLHLLKNSAAYKPSHWAPYVLVGDWR